MFPTDMRYGWNMGLPEHRNIIISFNKTFKVGIELVSPECTPWSLAITAAYPEMKHEARIKDQPALQWTAGTCKRTEADQTDYVVENPNKSKIWDESPLV